MKLVFTSQGTDWESSMDPRFGRTRFFFVYDDESEEVQTYDNTAVENEAHGAGPKTARTLTEFGAQVLITGNGPGGNAAAVLQATGTEVYVGAGEMTIREAYEAYRSGSLKRFQGV
ncbi:dinitrogenase iron-molybdenum cofactor biosynthesis protein [bacterium]|nr:MAG: dinitrogenase iron-molybdenum cofactor biosynthesis protein [bacterium]